MQEPGGGHIVRLVDPDGYRVEVVTGQEVRAPALPFTDPPRNTAAAKPRTRAPVRLASAPAHIQRIGHAVLRVRDFRRSEAWYKARFGLLTSDEVEAARDVPLGAFLRCDRGDVPSDHHTLFLAQLPGPPGLLHAAFEIANLDDLMLGHQHLKAAGRKPAWGVGRHIMGSQIFDYWLDPFGNELEHWTDGDLFTADDPPQKQTMQALLAVQWGTPHPMLAGRLAPPAGLIAFIMALRLRVLRLFRRKPEGTSA
ncbi:MAG: VOC family protein [Novosphingobium sp.]|nr:VOC family protein [Novosphingobium sp.]